MTATQPTIARSTNPLPADLSLVDSAGLPLALNGLPIDIVEGCTYRFLGDQPTSVRLDGVPLKWTARGASICVPFTVGRTRLDLLRGPLSWTLTLRVLPAPHKVAPTTWAALLTDLETWLPGLVVGGEEAGVGGVGTVGVGGPLLAAALLPLVPELERALEHLIAGPRRRTLDHLEERALHRTRAADRETVAWLARHPRDAAWLDPARAVELAGPPPTLWQRGTIDTLDHPANRHVCWLLDKVHAVLHTTADALDGWNDSQLTDGKTWRQSRAVALRVAANRLGRRRRRSFLRQVRAVPGSESALLVVMDHPVYARVHRLARRIVAARFSLSANDASAPTRPSFTLYELWTFLAVQRHLAATLGPAWHWRTTGLGRLLRGTGAGAAFHGAHQEHTVDIQFNPTFRSLWTADTAGPHSISAEYRPDIVVSWQHGAHQGWRVYDAKYRVGNQALGAAMSSAHVYRDALRWPAFGGRCTGAFLLAPRAASTGPTAAWTTPELHAAAQVGVVVARPGAALVLPRGGASECTGAPL